MYIVFASALKLPKPGAELFRNEIISWSGVVLYILGLILFLLSLISFGKSFRVGIDEEHPGSLVTTGVFAISRNPIYTAFGLVLIGIFLIFTNWILLLYLAASIWLFNRQVIRSVLYNTIPQEMQGSVFSVRNAIQYSTIPIGILLGGYLADYAFEPFMKSNSALASILRYIVGTGDGNGMAVMFLCTGILGLICSLLAYRKREIQELQKYDNIL